MTKKEKRQKLYELERQIMAVLSDEMAKVFNQYTDLLCQLTEDACNEERRYE